MYVRFSIDSFDRKRLWVYKLAEASHREECEKSKKSITFYRITLMLKCQDSGVILFGPKIKGSERMTQLV